MQGFQGREGRVALVLLNLCHPEDDEGDYLEAINLVEWWNGGITLPIMGTLEP